MVERLDVLQDVVRLVCERLEGVVVTMDCPPHSNGGFVDFVYNNNRVTIEYRSAHGFGIWTGRDTIYGEGPEVVFKSVPMTAGYVVGGLLG